jgi:hypothetical protein
VPTDIIKDDVQMFLEYYRKDERADPLHKWICTYNLKLVVLLQFFKWLYDPDNPDPKSRKAPSFIAGIKLYKRKEESIYAPEDLWTEEDDLLFLKYANSVRDATSLTLDRVIVYPRDCMARDPRLSISCISSNDGNSKGSFNMC